MRAIAKLAADLGIPTVAEGVETEEQGELLRAEGCIEMQGHLFSWPVSSDAIVKLLNAPGRRAHAHKCLLSAWKRTRERTLKNRRRSVKSRV